MTGQNPSSTAVADDRSLKMEHVFKAPPPEVFRAWTDLAVLKQWWAPDGFTIPDAALDVRPGGAWHSSLVGPDGKRYLTNGVIREIVPNKRIVMTWAWVENGVRGHETIVEVTLEPKGKGTLLRLSQRVFETVADVEGHTWGWKSSFEILERLLA